MTTKQWEETTDRKTILNPKSFVRSLQNVGPFENMEKQMDWIAWAIEYRDSLALDRSADILQSIINGGHRGR